MSDGEFLIRSAMPSDVPFVADAWIKSCRELIPWVHMDNVVFLSRIKQRVNKHIQEDNMLVACDSVEPGVIYGWISFNPSTINYVYVKSLFRKLGIAKLLLVNALEHNNTDIFAYSQLPTNPVKTALDLLCKRDKLIATYDPWT